MQAINRLDESVRNLGQRTGENEKQLAVHEAECTLRYDQVARALAALQKELTESSTKQIMLIRFVGGGMGAAFAAYMAAKSMGWF